MYCTARSLVSFSDRIRCYSGDIVFLIKILEFVVDFFLNLTIRKAIGGILVLIGLSFVGRVGPGMAVESAVLVGVIGIVIGGIGATVIVYDQVRVRQYSDAEILSKAFRDKPQKRDVLPWNMDDETKTDN